MCKCYFLFLGQVLWNMEREYPFRLCYLILLA